MALKQEELQSTSPSALTGSAMTSQAFHYPLLRFCWAMLAIAWSAFAHPLSSTVIDLESGQVHHDERG